MKTKINIPSLLLAVGLVLCSECLFCSCTESPTDVLPTKDLVWNYYFEKLDYAPEFSEGYAAYFDFSDGMSEAYKDPDTRENLKGITQKITGTDWIIYGLASNKLDTLRLSQTDLYNMITQPRYKEIMAPIEQALQSIVKNRKRALLVTDFEEYTVDKHIQYQNYAKKYFIEWLTKGGIINFYITDYKEGRQNKHLYFAVFDDYQGSMTKIINDALTNRTINYKKFCLNNKPVVVFKNYSNPNKGGNYHDATGLDIVTAVNEDDPTYDMYTCYENGLVEFYPCGASWNDIYQNAKDVAQLPDKDRFYSLFSGIIMDSSNKDSYIVDRYDLKVTNVQKDFKMFSDYQAALRNPPTITKNPDGTVIVENIDHPDAQFYYDSETGDILPEYNYTPQSCPAIRDLFALDTDVIEESKREKPDLTEIAIDFSPNFSPNTLTVESGDLLRIDVVIAEASPNLDNLNDLFSWGPDKNGQINSNLSEAIRNTLQESSISPVGQILFTYFVKAY